MLPIPTRSAAAVFAGCVVAVLAGIALTSVAAVILGMAGLTALAFALALTLPLGRQMRRQRLEFAWWLGHEADSLGGAVVPGTPFEVRCYVRHRGAQPLLASEIRPIAPGGVRWLDHASRALEIAARSRTEFAFQLRAPAVGRVVLQGLAITLRGPFGLFDVPLYFPNPLVVRVLPRAARQARARVLPVGGLPVERSARMTMRRRGGGTELYELRELIPGDPYNSIAWKASARIGKLMVKEVEHEVQETRWIIVDVSGTMRAGEPGSRKLDFAIELTAAEARRALQHGDRVGVTTVDGRILSQVLPGDGATQMPRIYDALLAATEVVDADLTGTDDQDVVEIVGRYVRHQDGVDYARKRGWDVTGLLRHVGRAMRAATSQVRVQATDPALAPLRRFCQARGIPIPYRPDPREGTKAPGLATAMRAAGRASAHLLVVTDFDGVTEFEPLVSTVKLLRAHGHRVVFIVPEATSFAPPPATTIERDLFRIYALAERRRVREARSVFGGMGIPVIVVPRPDASDAHGLRAGVAEHRSAA